MKYSKFPNFLSLSATLALTACADVDRNNNQIGLTLVKGRTGEVARVLSKKGSLSRMEFISLSGLPQQSDDLHFGAPSEGRVGLSESWEIDGGFTIKATGFKPWDVKNDNLSMLIGEAMAGTITNNFKITRIWVYDKSGELISDA